MDKVKEQERAESYKQLIEGLLKQINENAALYYPKEKPKKFRLVEFKEEDEQQPHTQSEIIAGYIHEIDSLREINRKLGEQIRAQQSKL